MRSIYDSIKCPKCEYPCERESVDIEVGIIHGPYGCPACGWSEMREYDISDGQNRERNGGIVDQYGGWTRIVNK